jgi:predicted metal-dependent peptidase
VYDSDSDGSSGNNPPPDQSGGGRGTDPDPNEDDEQEDGAGGEPDPDTDTDPQQDERDNQDQGQGQNPDQGQDSKDNQNVPPPLTQQERDTLEVQWQQRLAGAAQQAMQAGKLGGTLARMIDHLLQPRLPWRMLLAKYLTASARDDFSYMRPSRREGEAIFPSLRSAQVEVAVAIDTSGSIKRGEMEQFLAEVSAIKGQIRARVQLIPCDAEVAEGAPWTYEPWEECELPDSIRGGGGTDFRPVFTWLETSARMPDALVYFTDAEGKFPKKEADFPVIWLVKGKNKVPWGQRIQLN